MNPMHPPAEQGLSSEHVDIMLAKLEEVLDALGGCGRAWQRCEILCELLWLTGWAQVTGLCGLWPGEV